MNRRNNGILYWLPFACFFAMLIDGQLTTFFTFVTKGQVYMNSHILILVAMLAAFYIDKTYMWILMTVIGMLFDNYYLGIIGIYTLSLPLFILLHYFLFEDVKPTAITLLFGYIVSITFVESASFLLQMIFQISDVSALTLITRVLGPTLLINITLYILCIYPIKKLIHLDWYTI